MALKSAPKLRRWSPGEAVNSAARLNEVIDAVVNLRETVGASQSARKINAAQIRTAVIVNLTGPAIGQVLCEWKIGGNEEVPIYLWPKLYPTGGYTYSSNNARNHSSSGIDEEMVPQLSTGEVLRVQYFYHPNAQVSAWFDMNCCGRMWGEVVTPP